MNRSRDQQRMLQAMGYQLLVRTEVAEAMAAALVVGPHRAVPVPDAPTRREMAAPTGRAGGPSAAEDALRRALRRAAGDRDVDALVGDLERLRREPALKRALWPKLRALRRSH